MTEKNEHSPIGASSYHRWKACPGSVRLSKGITQKTSKYAEEGTRAHEIAAEILKRNGPPKPETDEMAEAVNKYVQTIYDDYLVPQAIDLFVEHKFDLSFMYPGLFGTADAVLFHRDERFLSVYDFKYGSGVGVEVKNNLQLMYYAAGAAYSLKLPVSTIEIVIVQPRFHHPDGPVRRWEFQAFELMDFVHQLVEDAKKTEDPNAPINPGSHCRFCPAAGVCPAIHQKAITLAKSEFSPVISYNPEKLGEVLHWLPTLEGWIEDVRRFAYGEAERGRTPPGWKLVPKRKTRRWKDEDATIDTLHAHGIVELFTNNLKSPAQIEKLLKKDERGLLDELVISESSGVTLVPDRDPRAPVNVEAKTEFSLMPFAEQKEN